MPHCSGPAPAPTRAAARKLAAKRFLRVSLVVRRLDRAGAELDLDPLLWAVLCAIVLPEAFAAATPGSPTAFVSGTPAKIATMRLRVSRGESPFHCRDAEVIPGKPPNLGGKGAKDKVHTGGVHRVGRVARNGVPDAGRQFRAAPTIGGRRVYLGTFPTREQAEAAVAAARQANAGAADRG